MKTGHFRLQQMNPGLKEAVLDKEQGDKLLRFTKSPDV